MNLDEYQGCRVLVTGANGFLGSNLCRALNMLGAEVHGNSRSSTCSHDAVDQWWPADLSDASAAEEIIRSSQPDVIFHLTSHGYGSQEIQVILPTVSNDLVASINMLTAATHCGVRRIVLTGSLEEPCEDDAEIVPCSPYAAAKWASTCFARMFHRVYNAPVVILRPFMTYGPGQRGHKVLPYVIRSLLEGDSPVLYSGDRLVDWVYVDDMIKGFMLAGSTAGIEGCTFELGTGKLMAISEVVTLIAENIEGVGKPLFKSVPNRRFERVRKAETMLATSRLGWQAETEIEEGLKATIEWYRGQIDGT